MGRAGTWTSEEAGEDQDSCWRVCVRAGWRAEEDPGLPFQWVASRWGPMPWELLLIPTGSGLRTPPRLPDLGPLNTMGPKPRMLL